MPEKSEILTFKDDQFTLDVKADLKEETVWLTQKDMSYLFDVNSDTVGDHIKNIYSERELDFSTTEDFPVVQKEGNRLVKRNLDITI